MNQQPTTAGTWAPDWADLVHAYWKAWTHGCTVEDGLYGVIADYQRQAAAAGLRLVPESAFRHVLAVARDACDGLYTEPSANLRASVKACYEALAATPESAPGGDE